MSGDHDTEHLYTTVSRRQSGRAIMFFVAATAILYIAAVEMGPFLVSFTIGIAVASALASPPIATLNDGIT